MADMTVIAEADAEIGALDLHHEWKLNHDCGFSSDLDLHNHEVANMASRLRGISAIARVLLTENPDVLILGANIRAGLIEAIDALAIDTNEVLELANVRTVQADIAARTGRAWSSSLDQFKLWAASAEGGGIVYADSQALLDRLGSHADAIADENAGMPHGLVWRLAHERVRADLKEFAEPA